MKNKSDSGRGEVKIEDSIEHQLFALGAVLCILVFIASLITVGVLRKDIINGDLVPSFLEDAKWVCNSSHMENKSETVSIETECKALEWHCYRDYKQYGGQGIGEARVEGTGITKRECWDRLTEAVKQLNNREDTTMYLGKVLYEKAESRQILYDECTAQDTDGDGYFKKTRQEKVCDGWILYKPESNQTDGGKVGRTVTTEEYYGIR